MNETELKKRLANIEDAHFTWQKTVRAHNTVVDEQIQRILNRLDLAEQVICQSLKKESEDYADAASKVAAEMEYNHKDFGDACKEVKKEYQSVVKLSDAIAIFNALIDDEVRQGIILRSTANNLMNLFCERLKQESVLQ